MAFNYVGDFSVGQFPDDITTDSNYIYVAISTSSAIYKYNKSGGYITLYSLSYVCGVTLSDTYCFASTPYNIRRASLPSLGSWTTIVSSGNDIGQVNNAKKLDWANPYLYTPDIGNHKVLVTDANGTYVTHIGSYGSGTGQFNQPSGVANGGAGFSISNYLYVADSLNKRVQVIYKPDFSFHDTITYTDVVEVIDVATFFDYLYVLCRDANYHVILRIYEYKNEVYELIFNQDLTTTINATYPTCITVDNARIYIGTTKTAAGATAYRVKMLSNDVGTYLYEPIYIQLIADPIGTILNISPISSVIDVPQTDVAINPISIEASGWVQYNKAEMEISSITTNAFAGIFGTPDLLIPFEIYAGVEGVFESILFESIVGINQMVSSISSVGSEGTITQSIPADLDIILDEMFSLLVATPQQGYINADLSILDASGIIMPEVLISGIVDLLTDLQVEGRTAMKGEMTYPSLLVTSTGFMLSSSINSIISIPSLDISGSIITIPSTNMDIDLSALIVSANLTGSAGIITGRISLSNLKVISTSSLIPIITGAIQLKDIDVSGRVVIIPTITGNISLYIPSGIFAYSMGDIVTSSKIQAVNVPLQAVSEYTLQASSVASLNGVLYYTSGGNLYKIDSTNDTTTEVVIALPQIDMDLNVIKRRIDMVVNTLKDMEDMSVAIYLYGYDQPIEYSSENLPRRDGEMRIKFGKGIAREGRYKKLVLKTTGNLEIDRIRLVERLFRGVR